MEGDGDPSDDATEPRGGDSEDASSGTEERAKGGDEDASSGTEEGAKEGDEEGSEDSSNKGKTDQEAGASKGTDAEGTTSAETTTRAPTTTTSKPTTTEETTTVASTTTTATKAKAMKAATTPKPAGGSANTLASIAFFIFLAGAGLAWAAVAYQQVKTAGPGQAQRLPVRTGSSRPAASSSAQRLPARTRSSRPASRAAAAAAADVTAEGAQAAKTKKRSKEPIPMQAAQVKAAIKLQALFRGWKARKHVAAGVAETGPRRLLPRQRFCLLIECKSGTSMPSVNTFGGCDAFVEFRLVSGSDPMKKKMGGLDPQATPDPGRSVQTDAVSDKDPKWKAKFELRDVPNNEDEYLQIILWDYNLTGNTLCGHKALTVGKALEGLAFDPKAKSPASCSHTTKFRNLFEEGKEKKDLPGTTVQCSFAYVELHRYVLKIVKGSRLPKVDLLGTCDGFVEARIVRGNVQKRDFEHYPDEAKTLWSAKTEVVNNNMDPTWNAEFSPVVPAYLDLQLQLVLWDSNSPLPDVPICHAVMELRDVFQGRPGQDPAQHKLRFSKLPKVDPPADIKKTQVTLTIAYQQVMAE